MACLMISIGHLKAQNLPFGFPQTERTKLNINQDWKFHLGDPEAQYFNPTFDDGKWEKVNVPHSLALTSLTLDDLDDEKTQLKFHRNVGWYRKTISVASSDRKVFLEFEGAHQITDLWVNGNHVGQHAVGGYTPFHFDISSYVNKGEENQITLKIDNRRSQVIPPDPGPFDYVKFSGLYRDLFLVETAKVHVTYNWESLNSGVYITTPTIDPINKNATINVKTAVKNESTAAAECKLITRIIDKEGIVVMKLVDRKIIEAGEEFQFNQIGSLEDNVAFWDIDNPYLYRVNSVVEVGGKQVDFVENKIGLRKFELDPELGFMLNNKPIELVGSNRHQQYPYVGDAVPDALHFKDMLQFKEFGFNVMRTAHYPQDDALIDACDELGILVYEEAPTWISVSQNEKWWDNLDHAARVMVRNHRNHPSIVMWGAGVNHRGYVPRIHNAVKQEDPIRLTASQGARWTGWQASGLTDINANMLYGPFLWDRSEPIFAMEGRRGPKALAPYKRDPKMVGLISWTAHAYYTFHPTHDKAKSKIDRTRSGMMTIFRYPRPQTEWYKSEMKNEPFLFIKDEWNVKTKEVTVYSNANKVTLHLNGEPIATAQPSVDTVYAGLEHPPFHFKNLSFMEGKLEAKADFASGTSLQAVKFSPGKPHAIQLQIDTVGREFSANGSDILMVYATIVDKNGARLDNAENLVTFSVKGDATIIGDGASINANPMFPEYGVAPALIQSGNTPGTVTITAKAKGLKSAQATANLVAYVPDEIWNDALPIYDFNSERVDLGAPDQLLQFGWQAWNGKENEDNSYTFKSFGGATATLNTTSKDGIQRWLGEMNVIGKYGFAYGDGVIAIDNDGLNVTFGKLPKGVYKLTSWHHAPRSNSDSMDPNKEKLKSQTIHKLPYENSLLVSSSAMVSKENSVKAPVTAGKEMQWESPGISEIIFEVRNNNDKVQVNFKGLNGKGIWLNAFELSEWKK